MCNASKQNQGFGIAQTKKLSSTSTRIVLVNFTARSLQQRQIRRFRRVYPALHRGCSSTLSRAIQLLGSSWFVRVPLSVTPFLTERLASTSMRIVLVNLAARSLQRLKVHRLRRVYPSPHRGCSSALKRAVELLGSSCFVRVPMSVTPFPTEGHVSPATRDCLG